MENKESRRERLDHWFLDSWFLDALIKDDLAGRVAGTIIGLLILLVGSMLAFAGVVATFKPSPAGTPGVILGVILIGLLIAAYGLILVIGSFQPPGARVRRWAKKYFPDTCDLVVGVVFIIPIIIFTLLLRRLGVKGYPEKDRED